MPFTRDWVVGEGHGCRLRRMKGRWRAGSGGAATRQCGQLCGAGHALGETTGARAHGRHGFAVVPDAFHGVQLPAEGQAPRAASAWAVAIVQCACVAVGPWRRAAGSRWQVGSLVSVSWSPARMVRGVANRRARLSASARARSCENFLFISDFESSHWRKTGREPGMLRIRYAYILPTDIPLPTGITRVYHLRSPTAWSAFLCGRYHRQSTSCPSRGSNGDKPYV